MSIEGRFSLRKGGFVLDLAFELPGRGVSAVFGPSGAGKTTLLRCVAGLERQVSGRLSVGGEIWQDSGRGISLPPHRRALGYVFQDAALFPHLSVRRNLEYGLRRTPPAQRRLAFSKAVEWLSAGPLLERAPDSLSGGERQRVAIARALLTSPRLLLMDEPMASLDRRGKAEILPYLERLRGELSLPVLYVSHDLDEVERLADQLLLLEGGRVLASGPVVELAARLDLPLVHGDAAAALVEAVVSGHDERFHLSYLDFAGGRLSVPRVALAPGARVRVRVQARDVSIVLERPRQTSILNVFPARVVAIAQDSPAQSIVRLDAGGTPVLARVTRKSSAALGLAPGADVYVQVKSVALVKQPDLVG